MTFEPDTPVVHILPSRTGRWVVQVGDDAATTTEHPTANVAERQARRRAKALGLDVILVRDRYQRIHRSGPVATAIPHR
jgi:Uncharacterized protein conserved in bacteria (DUF2188)